MPEGGHDGAWYCGRRPHFDDDGMRNFCPPEGCPKGYCAKDDGWKEGDATPDRCLGIQPAAHVGEHLAAAKGGGLTPDDEANWLRGDWYERWQDATENADDELMSTLESLRGRVEQTIKAALAERPAMPMAEREVRDLLLPMEDFINEPPRIYDIEPMEVREYRHQAYRVWSSLRDKLLALLSQDRGEGVEEVVMLPREPTEAMMNAGLYHSSHDSTWADVHTIWKAMFDAVALDGGTSTQLPADPATLPSPASGEGERP